MGGPEISDDLFFVSASQILELLDKNTHSFGLFQLLTLLNYVGKL